jgi:D-alanine-D-alanine ligase
MKKKVFVLYGGKSAEHEVSLASALNVMNELNKDKYDVFAIYITQEGKWSSPYKVEREILKSHQLIRDTQYDLRMSICAFLEEHSDQNSIVFPVLHGPFGEDGRLQGMLEMLDLAYVGNGVLASSVGMDKVMSKKAFEIHHIPHTPYVYYNHYSFQENERTCVNEIKTVIGFPCYVKPANMGSSVGISYCQNDSELMEAILTAFQFDDKILIEKEIVGKEVILGVLGNHSLTCSLAGEWQREQQFFDFDDKYLDDHLTPQIPALIPDETYQKLCIYAKEAFKALDGAGLMRIDFFVTEDQTIYLNEVNTLPGFTEYSMFPVLFERTENLSYSQLLDQLIMLGFEQYQNKSNLQFRRVEV